ncbi:hypothetical protein NQZ68_018121 [Dissostichus eleginoides]|nr:hypothetical protein NQZ68_018065 [Dissostichus eleginoides]KAI9524438.1 hypothetical protein NQZ68_018121 [Dissostichus eleginoides]
MVLVVGVRYMYRQACGKRTEVTLHDREREYARGERGLLHVQECGDLVRVRRIRENSFVLLAEHVSLRRSASSQHKHTRCKSTKRLVQFVLHTGCRADSFTACEETRNRK